MLTADVWNSVDFTPHVLQSTGAELRNISNISVSTPDKLVCYV